VLTGWHGEAGLAPLEDDLERAAHDGAADWAMRMQPPPPSSAHRVQGQATAAKTTHAAAVNSWPRNGRCDRHQTTRGITNPACSRQAFGKSFFGRSNWQSPSGRLQLLSATERGLVPAARCALAVSMGKAVRSGARRLGRGNGSSLPGAVALAIDPSALAELAAQIPHGSVLVTGSNGKGTTCRMLAEVMRAAGLHPVLNHEGSNQLPGLTATLVARSRLTGRLPADERAIGLFEVDEGSLPAILPQVARPRAVVITNIFRDQVDRYLEPDFVTRMLERVLRKLPAETTLVLNADDPRLAYLAAELKNPRLYFGIADTAHSRAGPDRSSDSPRCPRCGGELSYQCVFYAQLGHWRCGGCGLSRPAPQVEAAKVELLGAVSSRLQVTSPAGEMVLGVPFPGLYNAYNALGAVATAIGCQLPDAACPAIEQCTPGSYRMERVAVAEHDVYLVLAKNANGFTEVIRSLLADGQPKRMMLGLNDCAGKQPDTSWIWDADFHALRGLVPVAVVSGNRSADLAVRLKYAVGSPGAGAATELTVEPDPVRAFHLALETTPAGEPLWVVSTSIVLRQLRRWLRRQGYAGQPWREQPGAAL
jgi:UDP-N-acetylmuramyl tripeptide synthase